MNGKERGIREGGKKERLKRKDNELLLSIGPMDP